MKRLLSIVFFCTIFNYAFSESITPPLTNEFCPNTEYTFTATIPKTYQSMIGLYSASVTQLPTSPVGSTFTFKGKFGDVNQKQAFRVNYTDGTSYDFEFKKIKSLFYATTCTPIQPNQTTITAPRCQVTNIPITFSMYHGAPIMKVPHFVLGLSHSMNTNYRQTGKSEHLLQRAAIGMQAATV